MGLSEHLYPKQVEYVQTFIEVGRSLGVTDRGLAIAVATSAVESCGIWNLASRACPESENYPHDGVAAGDYDSIGLFQQRAAWGSYEERMTPPLTAGLFYRGGHEGQPGLLHYDYNSSSRSMGQWAQAVQVSAFPDRYEAWADFGVACVAAYGAAPVVATPPVQHWSDHLPVISAKETADLVARADGKPNVAGRVVFRAAALRGCGNPLSRFARHGVVDPADREFVDLVIRKVQTKRKSPVTGVLNQDDLHWLGGTRGSKFHAVE